MQIRRSESPRRNPPQRLSTISSPSIIAHDRNAKNAAAIRRAITAVQTQSANWDGSSGGTRRCVRKQTDHDTKDDLLPHEPVSLFICAFQALGFLDATVGKEGVSGIGLNAMYEGGI